MHDTQAQDETLKHLVELARQTEQQVDRVSQLLFVVFHITDEKLLEIVKEITEREIAELTRLSRALVELPRSGEKERESV